MDNSTFYKDFQDIEIKKIPKSLDECREPSLLIRTLRKIAYNIHRAGVIISVFITICGFLLAIASVTSEASESVALFFAILITTAISTAATYFSFFLASVVMNAISSLVYNNYVTANIALYEAHKRESMPAEKQTDIFNER